MASARETAIIAAQGPNSATPSPMPTAWALVPPGSGMLNIITTKQKAAKSETSGIKRVCRRRRRERKPAYQKGVAAPKSEAHVVGLRYPSGMCIDGGQSTGLDTLFYAAIASFGCSCYQTGCPFLHRCGAGSHASSARDSSRRSASHGKLPAGELRLCVNMQGYKHEKD